MKKMNVNKEQISMSELENVNGGIASFASFTKVTTAKLRLL